MSAEPQFAVVAQGNLDYLKYVQREFDARGLRSQIIPPTKGCGST